MIDNYKDELPLGLGFSLSMNQKAMQTFSSMKDDEKQKVIQAGKQVQSKQEMEQLVNRLGEGTFQ